MEIDKETITKLCAESYESGQIAGYNLALDQIQEALNTFKKLFNEHFTKKESSL